MSNPEEGKSSPLLEELISAVQSSDGLAVGRLFERQGFEDVIQQLAKRHWQHRMAYNQASSEEQKTAIKENPMFLTVKDLILHYPAPTSVMVRKILVEDHGFSGTDFDHYFYQDERGDTATNILYFEYMVYMQEHELPSAGTFFRKPRNVEGFNGLNIMEKLDPEISKLMKDPDFTEKFDQSFSELESFRFMKSRLLEDQS